MEEIKEKINSNYGYMNLKDNQKKEIDSFLEKSKDLSIKNIKYFLLFVLPTKLKYASENDIYNIIYTIQSITIEKLSHEESLEFSKILEDLSSILSRIYKCKKYLFGLTSDPIINNDIRLVSLEKYKSKKMKKLDISTTYEKSAFEVKETKDGGQVILIKPNSISSDKEYKLLLEYPGYKYIKKGDIINCTIKRKLFYVYWEIDELNYMYPQESKKYLKEAH